MRTDPRPGGRLLSLLLCVLYLLLLSAPWLGAGYGMLGGAGGKMGTTPREGEGGRGDAPGAGEERGRKVRGMSMVGRAGSWPPSQPMCALETFPPGPPLG